MSAVSGFLNLSPPDRRIALLTIGAVPVVKGTLRLRGYSATTRLLERAARSPSSTHHETLQRARVAQRVMTRLPVHLTCLERSLVVWWLAGGEPEAQIRFGVQPAEVEETPRFHAWVELDGEYLEDGMEDPSGYLPLTPPESASQVGRFG